MAKQQSHRAEFRANKQQKATARQNRVQRQRAKLNAGIKAPTPIAHWQLPEKLSVMQIGLLVSVLLHLIFLSIHFTSEDKPKQKDFNTLEITLVNTKTETKPKEADAFAQFNLDRGGNTDKDKRVKSPFPATQIALNEPIISANLRNRSAQSANVSNNEKDLNEAELAKLRALEKQAQTLMIQLQSTAVITQSKHNKSKHKTPDSKKKLAQNNSKPDIKNTRAQEMQRLEAMIAKEYEAYQKRPKRKFFGGRVKESKYAIYYDKLRARIEKIGTANYPTAAKKLNLYGKLVLTFSIKKDGTIETIEVEQTSGYKVLDAAAKRIIKLSTPFSPFPEAIRKEADILHFTRTMRFTKQALINIED